jgi:hypothetical protein
MLKLAAAALLAASIALPAMAQTSAAQTSAAQTSAPSSSNRSPPALNAPATHDTSGNPAGSGYNSASARTSVMTDSGGLRASNIVGSPVYNDHDEKIGSIDDLVIGNDKTLRAVVSVGGFLGIGSKMVAVPFDKLQFGNTKGSNDNRVVIPGVTKDSLEGMPDYAYANRG